MVGGVRRRFAEFSKPFFTGAKFGDAPSDNVNLTCEELQKMVEQLNGDLELRTQKKEKYKSKYLDEKQRSATMRDYFKVTARAHLYLNYGEPPQGFSRVLPLTVWAFVKLSDIVLGYQLSIFIYGAAMILTLEQGSSWTLPLCVGDFVEMFHDSVSLVEYFRESWRRKIRCLC